MVIVKWLFKHIEWLICLFIAVLFYGIGVMKGMDRANHYWQWELCRDKAVKLELVASIADAFPGREVWLVETLELMAMFAITIVFVLLQKAVFRWWSGFRLKHK